MKKQHILFSNYHWEDDKYGKDHYDYAREEIWENDEEHRFANEDYVSDQQSILGVFTCPICGEEFEIIEDAKECCRDEKWETMDDIPEDKVNRRVYSNEEWDWESFEYEFSQFIKDSEYGLLLCGEVGTWRGKQSGGCYIEEFNDLYKFWNHCDYIKVYDEGGHLYIRASHHDGDNFAELKALTSAGYEYAKEHYCDDDQEVHEKLWNSTYYTRLPHYAHKVWGCKKGA